VGKHHGVSPEQQLSSLEAIVRCGASKKLPAESALEGAQDAAGEVLLAGCEPRGRGLSYS
jgi:hypothetical protein